MKRQIIFAVLIMALCLVSVEAQKSYPKYEGKPETDSKFVNFIKRNLGKTVYLKLSITDGDFVTNGYRGAGLSYKKFITFNVIIRLSKSSAKFSNWAFLF
jgi:hypothetical protein